MTDTTAHEAGQGDVRPEVPVVPQIDPSTLVGRDAAEARAVAALKDRREREQKAAEGEPEPTPEPTPDPTDEPDDDPDDAEQAAGNGNDGEERDAAATSDGESEPQTFEVTVNGKKQTVTLDELLKVYPKAALADKVINESNKTRQEAQAVIKMLTEGRDAPKEEPKREEPPARDFKKEIADLADKFDNGDLTMRQYEEQRAEIETARSGATQEQPQFLTREELQAWQFEQHTLSDAAAKMQAFNDANKDLLAHPMAQPYIAQQVRDAMAKDLVQAGANPNDVAVLRADEIGTYHRRLRGMGHGRDVASLFEEAATSTREHLSLKREAPGVPGPSRIDRKRDRQGDVRPGTARATAPVAVAKSNADIVAEERRARGLS